MPVVLARIDDRLVHGQVSVGWSRYLRAQRLLVVSDAAARDPSACALMEMGTPEGLAFECLPVSRAARRYADLDRGPDRTIVLGESPSIYLALAAAGAPVREVNLGGLHPPTGGLRLADGVAASPKEIEDLRALLACGIRIEVRPVPAGPAEDLEEILARLAGPGSAPA